MALVEVTVEDGVATLLINRPEALNALSVELLGELDAAVSRVASEPGIRAAIVTGAYAGEMTITGTGAGGEATAVAAIGDLVAIARDHAAIVPAPILREPKEMRGLVDHKLAEAV